MRTRTDALTEFLHRKVGCKGASEEDLTTV